MSKECTSINSEEFVNTCIEKMKSSGFRLTKTRVAVLKALSKSKNPLNPKEIFELVSESKTLGKIDQVTVYRILETFEELGLIHQVFPSGGYLPCFHMNCGDVMHILLHCSSCEEITELDIPQDTLSPMLSYLRSQHGFLPNEHLFQINGTCVACSPE